MVVTFGGSESVGSSDSVTVKTGAKVDVGDMNTNARPFYQVKGGTQYETIRT